MGTGWAAGALAVVAIATVGCGGVVESGDADGGAGTTGADPGAADGGGVTPASCPAGGPEGNAPLLFGPAPGGTTDLWRGLGEGDGEGESFTLPRAGVIDRVVVQIFSDPGVTACRTRIYRWCDGQRVLVSTTETPASAFPVYIIDAQPGATMWDQDLRTTSIAIDPPVPVAAGEEVEAVFSAVGGQVYAEQLVSVITMGDVEPDARAVFPDEAPGIPGYMDYDLDYHAQIHLR